MESRGKRRIHRNPNMGEVRYCRWWLDREMGLVRPGPVHPSYLLRIPGEGRKHEASARFRDDLASVRSLMR